MKRETHILARTDDKGRKLRTDCEHVLLERFFDRIKKDELSPDQFCRHMQAYCEFKKQDVAAIKALGGAEDKAPNTAARNAERSATGQGRTTPFGRSDDGTPYTRDRFRRDLTRSVTDIYGLDLPDPASANTVPPHRRKSAPADGGSAADTPGHAERPARRPHRASRRTATSKHGPDSRDPAARGPP